MREILLEGSAGLVALVDDEDFERVSLYKWRATRKRAGVDEYYAIRAGRSRDEDVVWMHRFILNTPKGVEVDHKDGNGLDNRRRNLRSASHSQNICNSRRPPNTTGFRGVFYQQGFLKTGRGFPFYARIGIGRKQQHLGSFYSAFEAASRYDDAARALHGEFATLNFPDRAAF